MEDPKKAWSRILEKAGIKDLRIHDLRRSLGSWQATTGASLSIIGKTLAHKNVNTTAIYARLNIDPVREAMDKATKAMLSAAEIGEQNIKVVKLKTTGFRPIPPYYRNIFLLTTLWLIRDCHF